MLFDANYSKHNGESTALASDSGARNDVTFRTNDVRTLEDEQLGAYGLNCFDERDGQGFNIGASWNIEQHDIKGGFEWGERSRFNNELIPDGLFTSVANQHSGVTALELVSGDFSNERFNPTNTSDVNGFNDTVNASPRRQEYLNAYDLNMDGTIDGGELRRRASL